MKLLVRWAGFLRTKSLTYRHFRVVNEPCSCSGGVWSNNVCIHYPTINSAFQNMRFMKSGHECHITPKQPPMLPTRSGSYCCTMPSAQAYSACRSGSGRTHISPDQISCRSAYEWYEQGNNPTDAGLFAHLIQARFYVKTYSSRPTNANLSASAVF